MSDKTIFMPQAHLDAWLEGLRSGRYTQTKGTMHDNRGYCCLGVLQEVIDGKVEPMMLNPTQKWLDAHHVRFLDRNGNTTGSPWFPAIKTYACSANDCGMPFTKIADLIELHAEGT